MAGITVTLECGCTIENAAEHTAADLTVGAKMGYPNCAASFRITGLLWPDGQPVTPWADPWHDVAGDMREAMRRRGEEGPRC